MSDRTPEPGVEPDGVNSPVLLISGFVSVVITLAVIFFAAGFYFQQQNSLDEDRVLGATYEDSANIITSQEGVLASYESPAAEGKPYKIPIGVAKKLVLAELQAE